MEASKRITLAPNVNLTWLPSDKFKTDYLSISLLRPLDREEAALNSLLPEVLFQGCEAYPDMQAIADRLDDLYGAGVETMSRRRGEVQLIGLFGDCVDDRWTGGASVLVPTIQTMGQLLLHPFLERGTFCQDYVASEQQNLIRAIQAQINNKRAYASRRLLELMFSGEAYGVNKYGTVEQVQAITPERLFAHYQTVLAQSRVELFFMGAAQEETVVQAFRDALRDLPRETPARVGTQVVRRAGEPKQFTETMDVAQGQLLFGLRTGCLGTESGFAALQLMNAILGGTVSSKLFRIVREQLSLCYSVSSGLDRAKGIMTISAGIAPDNYQVAKDAILAQLEACRAGDITDEELEQTRRYLASGLRMNQDTPSLQESLSIGNALDNTQDTFQQRIQRLAQVTKADVQAAAQALTLDTEFFLKGDGDAATA